VAIIESLCSEDFVSRQHEKKLSQAIVLYYNAKDKMASLLDWAIAREVRGAGTWIYTERVFGFIVVTANEYHSCSWRASNKQSINQ